MPLPSCNYYWSGVVKTQPTERPSLFVRLDLMENWNKYRASACIIAPLDCDAMAPSWLEAFCQINCFDAMNYSINGLIPSALPPSSHKLLAQSLHFPPFGQTKPICTCLERGGRCELLSRREKFEKSKIELFIIVFISVLYSMKTFCATLHQFPSDSQVCILMATRKSQLQMSIVDESVTGNGNLIKTSSQKL